MEISFPRWYSAPSNSKMTSLAPGGRTTLSKVFWARSTGAGFPSMVARQLGYQFSATTRYSEPGLVPVTATVILPARHSTTSALRADAAGPLLSSRAGLTEVVSAYRASCSIGNRRSDSVGTSWASGTLAAPA